MEAPPGRGQTDIDRLFYLITGIVAVLVIVPAVMGVAGIDIRNASLAGDQAQQPDEEGVRILSAYGTQINDDRSSLGVVEVVVTAGEGTEIDLSGATVSWDGAQQYQITPDGVDVGTGSFAISGNTTLSGPTDRATLRFDPGTDDLSGADEFGERLEPGDSVTIAISTDDGGRATRELVVPEPLPSGAGVSLL